MVAWIGAAAGGQQQRLRRRIGGDWYTTIELIDWLIPNLTHPYTPSNTQ